MSHHPYHKILTTRFKTDLILRFIKKLNKKNIKILDIGCGSGYLIKRIKDEFPNYEVFGIDVELKSIEIAKTFSKAKFSCKNAESLVSEFGHNFFDLIISTDVMEHIKDYEKSINETYKVLKNNGIFYVYTPSIEGLMSKSKMAELFHQNKESHMYDYRYFTKNKIETDLKKQKFELIHSFYHNIFFQEFFTQTFKLIIKFFKKEYDNQGDIYNLTNSKLFTVYKFLFPLLFMIIKIEEWILKYFFRNKIKGHRLVVICEK